VVLATPAFAAKLYLKDGGVIQAKRVWREGGRVHVLATRHTMTSFEPREVNLKRTFVKRHRPVKKISAVQPQAQTAAAAPNGAAANQKPVEKKSGVTLPVLPKLPEKSPASLTPASGNGGGAIRKHNKEMAEKIGQ
jgi:hypothetical protein